MVAGHDVEEEGFSLFESDDAGAVALALIIREFVESGRSIACHSHEFGCEGGWRQHPSEPLSVHIRGGHEAVGEPRAWVIQSLRMIDGR